MPKQAQSSIRQVLMVAALVIFASMWSMAQSSSSQSSQSSTQDPQSSTSQTQSPQSSTSSAASTTGDQQTIDGCIVRHEADFFVQPASGSETKLNTGGKDLSAHVGQHVRATGTMNTSSSSSGGMGSSAAGTGSSGNMGSSAGTTRSGDTSASGTSRSGDTSASSASAPELVVTRVDLVEQSCPQDIQKQIDKNKKNH